jgi:hypothetical protein
MATFKTFFGFNTGTGPAAYSLSPEPGAFALTGIAATLIGPVQPTTLDPAKTSASITLSNGNLTATRGASSGYASTLSQENIGSKVYAEATITEYSGSLFGISDHVIGDDVTGVTNWLGYDAASVGLYVGQIWHNSIQIGTLPGTEAPNDTIGIAVDRVAQTVAFRNVTADAAWSSNFSIAALGTGPLFCGFTFDEDDIRHINFDGAFAGAVPAGFTRWNGEPVVSSYTLTANTGAFALAGQAAGLRVGRVLKPVTGAVALTGNAATLTGPAQPTTLDPAKTSANITLSNGNLTAARGAGAGEPVYATTLSYGNVGSKVYAEATITELSNSLIGVSNSFLPDNLWLGANTTSIGLYKNRVYYNGSPTFLPNDVAAGDTIGIAVDMVAQTIAFRDVTVGGAWSSNFSITTLGAGPLFCGFTLVQSDTRHINFDGVFAGAVPAGFTRWNGEPAVSAYTLTANTGAFALAGQAAILRAGRVLAAAKGTFALAGQAVALRRTRMLAAARGAFTLTGIPANLNKSAPGTLIALPGAITLTGNPVDLRRTTAYRLTANTGAIALAGQQAILRRGYVMAAARGAFALAGNAVNLTMGGAGYRLFAAAGDFLLSGKAANLVYSRRLALRVECGEFRSVGSAAYLFSDAPFYPVSMASLRNRIYYRPI